MAKSHTYTYSATRRPLSRHVVEQLASRVGGAYSWLVRKRIGLLAAAFALLVGSVFVAASVVRASPAAFRVGGGSGAATIDPGSLPPLPAEGLLVGLRNAVLLVRLDGSVIGRLVGFRLAEPNGPSLVDRMVAQEMGTTPQQDATAWPVLVGPDKRDWQLVDGKVTALPRALILIPGDAEIIARVGGSYSRDEPDVIVRDTRTHRPLAPAGSRNWFVTASGLLVTPTTVTDLVTRTRWRLRAGTSWQQGREHGSSCNPAGISGEKLIAVCGLESSRIKNDFHGLVRVFSVQHNGRREPLGKPLGWCCSAQTAFLSPDGSYVTATLSVPCGPPAAMVASTHDGVPHYITGSNDVLGFAQSGSIVASFDHGRECAESPPEIDLVNATTLARSRVYSPSSGSYALWSSLSPAHSK